MYLSTHTYMCMYVCRQTCTMLYVGMCACMYMCIYVGMYTHMTDIHMHTSSHPAMYVCMQKTCRSLYICKISNATFLRLLCIMTVYNATFRLNQKLKFTENTSFIQHTIAIHVPAINMHPNAIYVLNF